MFVGSHLYMFVDLNFKPRVGVLHENVTDDPTSEVSSLEITSRTKRGLLDLHIVCLLASLYLILFVVKVHILWLWYMLVTSTCFQKMIHIMCLPIVCLSEIKPDTTGITQCMNMYKKT